MTAGRMCGRRWLVLTLAERGPVWSWSRSRVAGGELEKKAYWALGGADLMFMLKTKDIVIIGYFAHIYWRHVKNVSILIFALVCWRLRLVRLFM